MHYQDMKERCSVISFLSECSDAEVVAMLKIAGKGQHEKTDCDNNLVYLGSEENGDIGYDSDEVHEEEDDENA